MANYKQASVNGTVEDYQRSNKVIISNDLNAVPEITFLEQILTTLPDGRKLVTGTDKCVGSLSDASEQFDLLLPNDELGIDTVIGTCSFMEVYLIVYSLYRHIATKRDSAIQEAIAQNTPAE